MRKLALTLLLGLIATSVLAAQARRMVVIDEDTAGPAGTDLNSILLLLQAPNVDVLGVTVVAGDSWLPDEAAHGLRLLELFGHSSTPLAAGAAGPLVRTRASTAAWVAKHGEVPYQGMWTSAPTGPGKAPEEGKPSIAPIADDAAHFLVRTVEAHPHQVTVYAGGPMTNLALALRLDPQFAAHTAGLVFMGGSIAPKARDAEINADPHREFNFWFDPDAARTVLRAAWPSMTCTPVDASVQTRLTPALLARLAAAHSPAGDYIHRYSDAFGNISYMWDELAALAWIDPAIITHSEKMYLDVNADPNSAAFGDTISIPESQPHDAALKLVTVQLTVDVKAFEDDFVKILARH